MHETEEESLRMGGKTLKGRGTSVVDGARSEQPSTVTCVEIKVPRTYLPAYPAFNPW